MKKQLAALLVLVLLLACAVPIMAFADDDLGTTPPADAGTNPLPSGSGSDDLGTGNDSGTGNNPGTGNDPSTGNDPGTGNDPSTGNNPGTGNNPATTSPVTSPTASTKPAACTHEKTVYACNGDGSHYKYCLKCGKHLEYGYCVASAFPVDLGGVGHNEICAICGGAMFGKHSDNNNNGKCDICGHDMNDLSVTDSSTGLDRAYKTGDKASVVACALLLVIGASAISLRKKHSA